MSKKPAPKPKEPSPDSARVPVRVRMYRQGLGDCFLLTFGSGEGARHILIDCGTLGAQTNGNPIAKCVDDIKQTTGGHLHAVVATHEHKDHLSGFSSCRPVFDAMTIDRCWVAWTENPKDKCAQDLEIYKNDLGMAAAKGVRAMKLAARDTGSGSDLGQRAAEAAEVLGFFGDDVLAAGQFAPTIHASMELVRKRFEKGEAEYLLPGTLVDVQDWLPGFRVYVLGPPRSKDAIQDTGMKGGGDLYPYPIAGIAAAADAFAKTASREDYLATLPNDRSRDEFSSEVPFDVRFQRSDGTLKTVNPLYPSYADPQNAWRRVDADWLGFSSVLALQLDNYTNNTSLALAFERVADGKVLLFPADAQRGNWESWSTPKELTWTVTDKGGDRTVRTSDLLKRTVFYKVGHHSSHNATARVNGLEKMEQNSLVAFIPLDRKVAKAKGWDTMPTRALYQRLMEKCNGRVLRSDLGWVAGTPETEFESMFTAAQWKAFGVEQNSTANAGTVTINKLFIDFLLP